MLLFDRFALTARAVLILILAAVSITAQSTSQDYPTAVTTSEITGTIRPRDVGDSRVTSHYYQFEGGQGDLFINVTARNFTGDIDLFSVSGLRPLTKIVLYGDVGETETGRVIYFRRPERIILRVQGRTPGDDAATYRIKFAGSFIASTQTAAPEPELPSLTAKNESGIRVNSVGTIVEVIPKATPTPPVVAAVEERDDPVRTVDRAEVKPDERKDQTEAPPEETDKKVEVVVSDNIGPTKETPPPAAARRTNTRRRPPTRRTTVPPVEKQPEESTAATTPPRTTARRGRAIAAPPKPAEPDPLEKVNLVVLFKDGTRMERPMSEVLRFTVDRGVLTVISKDGSIGRYSILDVLKVTIE